MRRSRSILLSLAGTLVLLAGCTPKDAVDEATASGKTEADFPETTADIFHEMDLGIALTPEEIAGRNTWLLWTGGNEAFWDYLARNGYGLVEFLKTIDSRQRPERFKKLGLINEPGYRQTTQPDEFGLYLDQPISPAPDGTNPAVVGKSTGVIGFRLFPNPNFDEAARKRWDANRFYNDPSYYQDPKLVRPYRVGMTCALCHVAFHPLKPPQDNEEPRWENLSTTLGNQYIHTRGVFGGNLKANDFLYHVLDAAHPGTIETSIIATDNNNNPNIVNSIYNVAARLGIATEETMAGPAVDFPPGGKTRRVPHVLVDGADSIGVPGALDRVFVNIGTFGEEWVRCHNPIIGGRTQKPFSIPYARKHSVYWRATEARTPNLTKFLIRVSDPMPLRDAPGGANFLTTDQTVLDRGKIVFAENCMTCHSSKQPPNAAALGRDDYNAWARTEVMKPDFLDNNYLSNDQRYPITLLETNASRALQDNATRGKIWEQFSSEDYKRTPSIGEIKVYDPFRKVNYSFTAPGGGPGFYRVPTLVGIWAGAPFLHNNSLGDYSGDPSVEGRVRAFDNAMEKMFSPDKRRGLASIARTGERSWFVVQAVYLPIAVEGLAGRIVRPFMAAPWLLPAAVLLIALALIFFGRRGKRRFSRIFVVSLGALILLLGLALVPINFFLAGKMGDLKIGPIPKRTPVNLFASMNPHAPPGEMLSAIWKTYRAFHRIEAEHLSDEEAARVFNAEAGPALMKVSKSPDWVEDRGHYFPVPLSDEDKRALKEFLKTF